MHVRMPRCDQRNTKLPREISAEYPQFAWPRDVDHVRAKTLQLAPDQPCISPKQQIERKIFLDPHRHPASSEFERPQLPHLLNRLLPAPGAHAKKGEIPPLGKCHEVSAGMRYSVDLVERIREIGNSRHTHRQ